MTKKQNLRPSKIYMYTAHTRSVPIIGSADKSATDKLIFTTLVISKTYPES